MLPITLNIPFRSDQRITFHCYKRLPMGVVNSPDIFQHKMNDLFHGFGLISAYIDDLLILSIGDWTYHVHKLELTLNKMK